MLVVSFVCMLFGLCTMWEVCLYIKEARLLMKPMLSQPPNFSQSLSMSHENYKQYNIAIFFFLDDQKWSANPVLKRGKIRTTIAKYTF